MFYAQLSGMPLRTEDVGIDPNHSDDQTLLTDTFPLFYSSFPPFHPIADAEMSFSFYEYPIIGTGPGVGSIVIITGH